GSHRGWRHDRADDETGARAAERGGAVAVPADRGLRLPLELPHGRARRARRRDRLALRPVVRLAERLRQPARPRSGVLPPGAVRHQPCLGAAVRGGHERLRDDVEDAGRVDRRARRIDDRSARARGRDHAAHAGSGRRRRRPHAGAHGRVQRSALAIKGLTYMPTGATVAALTTSLPETPGGERNWDYRYTWMRDTTFTLQALHWLNLDLEADEFMEFIADIEPTNDGSLQIMYGIDGRRDLTETTREELTGYAGAKPVRVGNGAFDQRQNDVFGAVLDSILLHTQHGDRLPTRLWP